MSIRKLLGDPKPNSPIYATCNIIGIVWQTLKRITKEILGVKELTLADKSLSFEKCWKLLMKQGVHFFLKYWLKKIRFCY